MEKAFLSATAEAGGGAAVAAAAAYHDWLIDQGRPIDAGIVAEEMRKPPVAKLADLQGRVLASADAIRGDLKVGDRVVFTLLSGQRCDLLAEGRWRGIFEGEEAQFVDAVAIVHLGESRFEGPELKGAAT